MIADYFTKALQGALFLKLRNMIMGNTEIPLPSNAKTVMFDSSVGIPDGPSYQESRSVLKNEVVPYSLEVLQSSVPHGRKVVPVGNQMSVMTPVLKRVDKSERPTYAEIVGKRK